MGDQLTVKARLVQLTISRVMKKTILIEVSLYPALTVSKTPVSSGRLTDRKSPIGSTNNPWVMKKTPLIEVSLYPALTVSKLPSQVGDQLTVKARLVQLTIRGYEENLTDRSFTLF
ncbi:hypothetical protein ACQKII_11630 [Lysinibacillus sp. NPDC048646]|uniref:hypothetical protein n=1 Tax=Lysinibacillus sp. NPDC048646 TaxID=3390574 RepID=UPI003CFBF5E6